MLPDVGGECQWCYLMLVGNVRGVTCCWWGMSGVLPDVGGGCQGCYLTLVRNVRGVT